MKRERTACARALDNLDDCIWQIIERLAETDTCETALDLARQLNDLDTAKILVTDLLGRAGRSTAL